MERITTSTVFRCPICGQTTNVKIQLLFDSYFDGVNHFPEIYCPNCKASFSVKIPFVYWKRMPQNELFFVFPSELINEFQQGHKSQSLILNDYRKQLTFADQAELKNATVRYCEAALLDDYISGNKREDFLIGTRNIRFTPALDIKINNEFLYQIPEKTISISKNEVSYCRSGLSELGKELFAEVGKRFAAEKTGVNLSNYQEEQHATTTMGFSEIALYIGSTIIIPVVVKVLGDVISNYFKERKKKREQKDENRLTIIIAENGTSNAYCFHGTPEKIVIDLRKFEQEVINTVSIPGVCHISPLIDDIVADNTFSTMKNISDAAKEYEKVFDKKTAVEFCPSDSDDEIISAKGKFLMDNGEYRRAYYIMAPHVENTTSIELLCNFAFCLKHLGANEEANELYYKAITMYLNRPDLEDLEKFACIHSQEQLDSIYAKVHPIVEEENSKLSEKEKKEIALATQEEMNSIYKFDIKDLCKEADKIADLLETL